MSFEQALSFNEEPRENWNLILPLQLSGGAKTALDVDTFPEDWTNYDTLKTSILAVLGDTPESCGLLVDYHRIPRRESRALISRITVINHRQLSNCITVEEVISLMTLSLFLS